MTKSRDGDAARQAARDAQQQLPAEREDRQLAEVRCSELRHEKARSDAIHRISKKEAEARISALTRISISAVLVLAIVIELDREKQERWREMWREEQEKKK